MYPCAPAEVSQDAWLQRPIVADTIMLIPRVRLRGLLRALRSKRDYSHMHLLCEWLPRRGAGSSVEYFEPYRYDANSGREANPLYRMAGRREGRMVSPAVLKRRPKPQPCGRN